MKSLVRFIHETHLAKEHYAQAGLVLLYGVLSASASLVLGRLVQNSILTSKQVVYLSLGIYILLYLSCVGIDWLLTNRTAWISEKIKVLMRNKVATAILVGNYQEVSSIETGDLIYRLNQDCDASGQATELVMSILRHSVVSLIMVICLGAINYQIAIAFLLPFPLIFFWNKTAGKANKHIVTWKKSAATITSDSVDIVSQREAIKVYCAQAKVLNWADASFKQYQKIAAKTISLLYSLSMTSFFLSMLPVLCGAGIGGMLVFQGRVAIGDYIASVLIAQTATQSLLNLPNFVFNIPNALESVNRVFEMSNIAVESSTNNSQTQETENVVEFSGVSFGYEDNVLDDITFTVKAGTKIALIGDSGCGKSTIVKLISGLLKPNVGTIMNWGVKTDDCDLVAM